jgi:hypothetical protein
MPPLSVSATNFDIPENAVRVLITGYGVSSSSPLIIIRICIYVFDLPCTHYCHKVSPPCDTLRIQVGLPLLL